MNFGPLFLQFPYLLNYLKKEATRLSGEKEKRFKHIHDSIASMTGLLEDVRLLSHNQNYAPTLNFSEIDLNVLSRDIVDEMQFMACSTHTIIFNPLAHNVSAAIDIKIFRHVLLNLLSNAIKYSPPGSEVTLSLTLNNANGDRPEIVVLRVDDQGIGIPASEQERLFSSFFRASNVGSTPGTGLGLAIARKFVGLHGGHIYCHSQMGAGSSFVVELPRHQAAAS
jgi:signal transduction histidine kinase